MELPSYFQRYLQAIQPSRSSRERAIQLHTTLRKRLEADADFQDWFADTFLYGSYRRNTAIAQIKDVDVCVLLKIPPDSGSYRPQSVVERLRRVLERNGYAAKTALQRRSVRIDLSGTTLDVVPVAAHVEGGHLLYIPDRPLEQWIPTYPREHLVVATTLNQECNGRFIPLVKIVKAWYRYQQQGVERPKPKGFTLEALVAQYQDSDAPSYAEAFIAFLQNLDNACGRQFSEGKFPNVPDPGRTGQYLRLRISEEEAIKLGRIVRASLSQAQTALAVQTVAESAQAWQSIFGNSFPTQPQQGQNVLKGSNKDEELAEPDGLIEKENREIDLPTVSRGALKITAGLATVRDGKIYQRYPSNGRALPKGWWLQFQMAYTSVPGPYSIRWTVHNYGQEAQKANDRGHVSDGTARFKWEQTKYRGSHTMICELHRNGTILATSEHIVNVK